MQPNHPTEHLTWLIASLTEERLSKEQIAHFVWHNLSRDEEGTQLVMTISTFGRQETKRQVLWRIWLRTNLKKLQAPAALDQGWDLDDALVNKLTTMTEI